MRSSTFLAALVAFIPSLAGAQSKSAPDTSAIIAARATWRTVEDGVRSGALARRDTTFECEENGPPGEQTFSTFRDSTGVVRLLHLQVGSDHVAINERQYYDAGGKLRFAFLEMGADNGTRYEERAYWNDRGEIVRRVEKLLAGPGRGTELVEAIPDPVAYIATFCEPRKEPKR